MFVSTLTNFSDNKIGNHNGDADCFPSLYCFLSLIARVLFL
jgi:hypothetical protein